MPYETAKNVSVRLRPGGGVGAGIGAGIVAGMSDRARKIVKPAAAVTVVATMASIWWFALRPRRKIKLDK